MGVKKEFVRGFFMGRAGVGGGKGGKGARKGVCDWIWRSAM